MAENNRSYAARAWALDMTYVIAVARVEINEKTNDEDLRFDTHILDISDTDEVTSTITKLAMAWVTCDALSLYFERQYEIWEYLSTLMELSATLVVMELKDIEDGEMSPEHSKVFAEYSDTITNIIESILMTQLMCPELRVYQRPPQYVERNPMHPPAPIVNY